MTGGKTKSRSLNRLHQPRRPWAVFTINFWQLKTGPWHCCLTMKYVITDSVISKAKERSFSLPSLPSEQTKTVFAWKERLL